jgi:AhpD family alkylhydroperoxidase
MLPPQYRAANGLSVIVARTRKNPAPGSEKIMADFYGKETSKHLRTLRQNSPDQFKGFLEFDKEVFKDGAIPSKTKELMAITAAHVTQCPWCIEAHVSRAKEKGCTDQEIAEAVWVAAAMRAGAAFSHGAIAMAVAEEHKH